jgi:hypothetical protein
VDVSLPRHFARHELRTRETSIPPKRFPSGSIPRIPKRALCLAGSFWEDKQGIKQGGRNVLYVNDTICFITEVITFCKRYYELIAPDESIHFELVMNGTNDRILTVKADIGLSMDYVATENPIILRDDWQVVELKASTAEIAHKITKQIFTLFNWDESDATITHWQTRLLERRL